jgi:hypothetical protein
MYLLIHLFIYFKRDNIKRGFISIGCYICNIYQTRNGNYQFRSITDITKNNIECNCKLIMAGQRKYQEEFIKYGFTSIVISGEEWPQCVICCEVPANESFKVNNLIRHLKTKHDSLADRGTKIFKRKAEIFREN